VGLDSSIEQCNGGTSVKSLIRLGRQRSAEGHRPEGLYRRPNAGASLEGVEIELANPPFARQKTSCSLRKQLEGESA